MPTPHPPGEQRPSVAGRPTSARGRMQSAFDAAASSTGEQASQRVWDISKGQSPPPPVPSAFGDSYREARRRLVLAEPTLRQSRECVLLRFRGNREMFLQWATSAGGSTDAASWMLFDAAQALVSAVQPQSSLDASLSSVEATYNRNAELEQIIVGDTSLWRSSATQSTPGNSPSSSPLPLRRTDGSTVQGRR